MNDLEVFESARPAVEPLSRSDREAMRGALFGAGHDSRPVIEHAAADRSTVVTLESRQEPGGQSRRWLLAAAAVMLVVGVAGLWASAADRGATAPAAPAPTEPQPSAGDFLFETPTVRLQADSIEAIADGQASQPVDNVVVHSDPGTINEYTTLEVTWFDDSIEQRINIYFSSDGVDWWASEIRTYDRAEEWVEPFAIGEFFRSPLGQPFVGDLDLPNLRIRDMSLEAFLPPDDVTSANTSLSGDEEPTESAEQEARVLSAMIEWRSAVEVVLADQVWAATAHEQLADPFTGIVVAIPGDSSVTVTMRVHIWYPGEYSDDQAFRDAVVGTDSDGESTAEGWRFVVSDAALSSDETIVAVLTPAGLVTVEAEPVPGAGNPSAVNDVVTVDQIGEIAEQLALSLPAMAEAVG